MKTQSAEQPTKEPRLQYINRSASLMGQLPSLEPYTVVETLLVMDYADMGSLDKHMQHACFRQDMVGV